MCQLFLALTILDPTQTGILKHHYRIQRVTHFEFYRITKKILCIDVGTYWTFPIGDETANGARMGSFDDC